MINLLPSKIKQERIFGRRNIIMRSTLVLLLGTCVLVLAVFFVSQAFISRDDSRIKEETAINNAKVLELEKQIKDISSVAARLETTNKVYESSINFSKLIPEIGSLLPKGTIINGLSLTGGITDPLTLSINMVSADLAPVLQNNLVQSDLFEAADINSITSIQTDGSANSQYKYSVNVSISFTGAAAAKAKVAAKAKADEAAKKAATEGPVN